MPPRTLPSASTRRRWSRSQNRRQCALGPARMRRDRGDVRSAPPRGGFRRIEIPLDSGPPPADRVPVISQRRSLGSTRGAPPTTRSRPYVDSLGPPGEQRTDQAATRRRSSRKGIESPVRLQLPRTLAPLPADFVQPSTFRVPDVDRHNMFLNSSFHRRRWFRSGTLAPRLTGRWLAGGWARGLFGTFWLLDCFLFTRPRPRRGSRARLLISILHAAKCLGNLPNHRGCSGHRHHRVSIVGQRAPRLPPRVADMFFRAAQIWRWGPSGSPASRRVGRPAVARLRSRGDVLVTVAVVPASLRADPFLGTFRLPGPES